jgi:hypothetical protein
VGRDLRKGIIGLQVEKWKWMENVEIKWRNQGNAICMHFEEDSQRGRSSESWSMGEGLNKSMSL